MVFVTGPHSPSELVTLGGLKGFLRVTSNVHVNIFVSLDGYEVQR